MEWIRKGQFNGVGLWTAELPHEGKWVASIDARRAGGHAVPPGSLMVPGKFSTVEEALEAARRYIVEIKQAEE